MAVKHDIAQIQIIPVEDGAFFIQVINADGSGQKNPRHAASDRENLVAKIQKLAEELFTKDPPPQPSQTLGIPHVGITRTPPPETPPADGTPEPQSPTGA